MNRRAHSAAVVLLCGALCSWGACRPQDDGSEPLREVFRDDFDRAELGAHYKKRGGTWKLRDGALYSTGEHNIPLWLDVPLPKNVKIEFTAWSDSPAVDTKVEVFGDGLRHESGYIVILGGWNNRITTIARLDEHEAKRPELKRGWERGRRYRWRIQRRDGRSLELYIDGTHVLSYDDEEPLSGSRHQYLGFTNWESEVHYDDLVITPL